MNEEISNTNTQETLVRLEKKIDKIERTVNPPFWLKLLRWIGRNFFTILILVLLIVMGYKIWEFLQHLQEQIESIKSMPANAVDGGKEAIQNIVEQLKFW